jgi:hypothetical protein
METEKYEEAVRDYETVSKLDKTSREYRYSDQEIITCAGGGGEG